MSWPRSNHFLSHTVFQNLRTVGCLNFYDIFDVCLSVCHPQMTRNSVHLFLPPKRKDRAILENSNISFSVYPELINFQKWFYSVRTVRQLFSGAFIVCVLEGNYNNELRDINFLSCSLDRDRIDNYSTTQTDVTKKYLFFFLNSKIPRTHVPPFFCIIVLSERMRQNQFIFGKFYLVVILGWKKPRAYLDTFISKFMSVWYHVVDNDFIKEVQDSFTSFSHWPWYIAVYAFGFWPRNKWIHDLQPQYYGRTFFENLIDNCRKWALVWNSSSQDPFCWATPKFQNELRERQKNKDNAKEAYAKWLFFAE